MKKEKLSLIVFTVVILFSMAKHWTDLKTGFLSGFYGDNQIVSTK